MARTFPLSRRALNRPLGSFTAAPFGNVSRTTCLSISPMQTMPPEDHTDTPSGLEGFFHFTSSTMEGRAPTTTARSRDSVSPRQSPALAMMASISREASSTPCTPICRSPGLTRARPAIHSVRPRRASLQLPRLHWPTMSDDTAGLVLTPPARNYSSWYQWMTRLAATTHEDPLPEGDPASIPAWVDRRRARLLELLGPEPAPVPLHLETLESEACDGYRRDKVVFDTEDTMSVPAYLLVPDSREGAPPG